MRQVNQPVFISDDGREFTSKKDCEDWEKHYSELMKNLAYFSVLHSNELTEGRGFQAQTLYAVVGQPNSGCPAESLLLHYLFTGHKGVVTKWYGDSPALLWKHKPISAEEFERMIGTSFRKVEKKYLIWNCKAGAVVETTIDKLMEY